MPASIRFRSYGERISGAPLATSCRTRSRAAGLKASWTSRRTSCSTGWTTGSSRSHGPPGGHPISGAECSRTRSFASQKNGGLLVALNEVQEAPRETPETAGAPGGTQRRFDSSWWTRFRRQSGGRGKAGAVFDLHDVGARLHDGLLSRELSTGPFVAARIKQFAIFTLTDRAEQDDDCANIYHKSLLYLVSTRVRKGTPQTVVPRC